MNNIISLKKKPTKYYMKVFTCVLEDGSFWYRVQDTKTGKLGEWFKIE